MDTITQFGEFQDGVDAGMSLSRLFKDLGLDIDELERPSPEELAAIFEFVWKQNTIDRPYPSVIGFLSTILRREAYATEIMNVIGAAELIQVQRERVPTCHLPENSGIITFGSWSGDICDGDAWCLDIQMDRICCLPVGSAEIVDVARLTAYAVFHDFHYLEAFLRKASEIRGLLPKRAS